MALPDVNDPGSPAWWLRRLLTRLEQRRDRYTLLGAYYDGDHRLPEGDRRCREAYRQFQRKARTNYCKLVADSVRERLQIVGFRTGGGTAVDTDSSAWAIWQANQLDADSSLVHSSALIYSDAYVIVGAGEPPIITVEDPRQVITEHHPVNRRRIRAGLKSWTDDVDGQRHAVVYLPDTTHYFAGPANQVLGAPLSNLNQWDVEDEPTDNPLGQVPLVRFVANPMLGGDGRGEFEDIIDVQDRVNDTVLNRLVITKLQAYRQRWVKGLSLADDAEAPFVPGVDLLWAAEDPDVEFGEFSQVDLTPMLKAVEADVHAIVMLTGLPPHYVAGDLVNASADALAAAEARLVSKVKDRQQTFGESWEQVMRLAFAYLGDADRIGPDAEVTWADPERRSEAQLADAALKKQTIGVPWRQNMTDLGYTPTEIDRMESERSGDVMLLAAAVPPPVNPSPAPGVNNGS